MATCRYTPKEKATCNGKAMAYADAVALVHTSGRSEFDSTQEPLEDAWGCHVA